MGVKSTNENKGLNKWINGHQQDYSNSDFDQGTIGTAPPPPVDGHVATGGVIYDNGGYRYHYFPYSAGASQTFQVTKADANFPGCEYLCVGGGGAGGSGGGSGGGAGGMVTGPAPITVASYTITVGQGAAKSPAGAGACGQGSNGGDSVFTHPGLAATARRASGGGKGGFRGCSAAGGNSGGSGGGGYPPTGGAGDGGKWNPDSPQNPGNAPGQGYPGGNSSDGPNNAGGGGGGYSSAGSSGQGSGPSGDGGAGVQVPGGFRIPQVTMGIGPTTPSPTNSNSGIHWVCGGGGGGGEASNRDTGMGGDAPETLMSGPGGNYGWAGGGPGAQPNQPNPNPYGAGYGHQGVDGTGGGGGGADRNNGKGGDGGDGFVMIRYQRP